jgi:glycosyltransferase involved in cell wall biosynthesis
LAGNATTLPTQGSGASEPRRQVAFLIRSLNIGGAERQLIELASGLREEGWRVDVVTFYPGGALWDELERRRVPVEHLAKRGRWDVIGFEIRLLRTLRRLRSPINHGYMGEANLMLTVSRPLLRKTRVVWGIRSADLSMAREDWLGRLLGRINTRMARRADLIICNSRSGMDLHARDGYPIDRMIVIPNGVDTVTFSPLTDAGRAVRDEWSVRSDETLIGIVGRLDPIKGHDILLRAVAPLMANSPVRVACVGTGPDAYRVDLAELASALGVASRVIWAGPRSDMAAVYNALDLSVSASHGEGFPNVVAEAMACGTPCVVTAVGDSAEIVGDAGWVCPPGDIPALRAAIASALSDPASRTRHGIRGRQRIVEHFSTRRLVQTTAERLLELGRT